MKIAIGCDHAGVKLKETIIEHFSDIVFLDVGTYSEESVDYPDYIPEVGYKIQKGEVDNGIVICGSGIGASIAANKINGIRAALCFNGYMAEMAKKHNDANIIAMGSRVVGIDIAIEIIRRWLNASFDGGRHQRRIDKLKQLEKDQSKK